MPQRSALARHDEIYVTEHRESTRFVTSLTSKYVELSARSGKRWNLLETIVWPSFKTDPVSPQALHHLSSRMFRFQEMWFAITFGPRVYIQVRLSILWTNPSQRRGPKPNLLDRCSPLLLYSANKLFKPYPFSFDRFSKCLNIISWSWSFPIETPWQRPEKRSKSDNIFPRKDLLYL